MKIIILCGGAGTRMEDYSFPKPLNMIYGKPAIYYTLKHLPDEIDTLHFVVAPHLLKYNFAEIVTNVFPKKRCIFYNIPYFTRGALESAYLGTLALDDSDEQIAFLDNDVVYKFPSDFLKTRDFFLGYNTDLTGSDRFSFMKIDDDFVIDYKEKVRISDKYCCGVYGFYNITEFRKIALEVLRNLSNGELYLSSAFAWMLRNKIKIRGIQFEKTIHVGSLSEVKENIDTIGKRKMRVCFDLDNTLVTYPSVPKDYSSVFPIKPMIELAQKLKSEGHTIIIHTARRMETHKYNVGAVIKDIGMQTMKTLEEFEIPYDELIFGKPIADMYIDDRAINPYRNDMRCMGFVDYKEETSPLNIIGSNKYNTIEVVNNSVCKRGPQQFMRGELFFYKCILHNSKLQTYFPTLYGTKNSSSTHMEIYMENIRGIPFYTLFKNEMITPTHISNVFEFIDMMHNTILEELPSQEDVCENYINKLKKRFAVAEDYPFENAKEVQENCLFRLQEYCSKPFKIRHVIHGDLWFSNIIIDFKNNIKFIDMKGQVNDKLTMGGDEMYDYGKLYQSFLGFDAALYGDELSIDYLQRMKNTFIERIKENKINIEDLKAVTFGLIMGTFHSIEEKSKKERVWGWINEQLKAGLM